MITTEVFGRTKEGEEVLAFTLSDGDSRAVILNYGGTIQSIVVSDKEGNPTDVVLGYRDIQSYEDNGGYLGALIGRFANRIDRGTLAIDGVSYKLYCNDRGNHLHGGRVGFNQKIWSHKIDGDSLILSTFSADGEENYPGNLTVRVTYSFVGRELKIAYRALSDKKTAINLTNHAYFNVNGEKDGSILDNRLQIDSDIFVPVDSNGLSAGGFCEVEGTSFDFRTAKAIGRDVNAEDAQLKKGGGYDHCYLLKSEGQRYVEYAVVKSEKTGITMRCATSAPAVHFYAGNGLKQWGKGGYYGKNAGFCLETECIPNNVNAPEYAAKGSSIYEAGQIYAYDAAYKFEV